MPDLTTLVPVGRIPSADNSLWYMGSLLTILVDGSETRGAFSLVDATARQGHEPPPHIHHREDETYYVLEGEITFHCGDQVIEAKPGMTVFLPRGVPHFFKIQTESARTLILLTPSGFENWFKQLSEPAGALTLPPAEAPAYVDVERLLALGKEYGIEFLPPPVSPLG